MIKRTQHIPAGSTVLEREPAVKEKNRAWVGETTLYIHHVRSYTLSPTQLAKMLWITRKEKRL